MDTILAANPQWINLIGLVGNFVGVAIVAFEWRTSMYDSLSRLEIEIGLRKLASGEDVAHANEIEIAPKAKKLIDETSPEELEAICSDDKRFDAFTKALLILDTTSRLDRRLTIFRLGFGTILFGTALQFLAAWPH
jgi:hypothetical protein